MAWNKMPKKRIEEAIAIIYKMRNKALECGNQDEHNALDLAAMALCDVLDCKEEN